MQLMMSGSTAESIGGSALLLGSLEELEAVAAEWNELALLAGNPFLTVEWLTCWWRAFGTGDPIAVVVRDAAGGLAAGAFSYRSGRTLETPANPETGYGHWDVLARNEQARREVWRVLAGYAPARLRLSGLMEGVAVEAAHEGLRSAGYAVFARRGSLCPRLALPDRWDALIGGVSRNLRSQVARKSRTLERLGSSRFRTVTGGEELLPGLEHLFHLEGSGWKAREGTAILSNPASAALYRSFAARASERGWVRLHLLELDGQPIAADLGCAFAGTEFLLKTGFDERHAGVSPGLVLLANTLRATIEEGHTAYDFLGGAQHYKMRWGAEPRQRFNLVGYRGPSTLPERVFERTLRPVAKQLVRAAASRSTGATSAADG